VALGDKAGAKTAAQLRAADIVKLFMAGLATGWAPEPVIDGVVLERQLAETFARGEQAKAQVLAGFNEGEIRSLMFLMPPAPDHRPPTRRTCGSASDRRPTPISPSIPAPIRRPT
jgi:para-nitrobenzyl esterase